MSEADKIIKNLKNSGKKVEEFYVSNKTSDKNVANIEDVNILGAFVLSNRIEVISQEEFEDVKKSIKNILAELEQKDKRIKELEEERDHWHGCFIVAMENGIAKEKVKNVLKNNRNEIFSATYLSREQFRPYEMQIERINKIDQELIGEDK